MRVRLMCWIFAGLGSIGIAMAHPGPVDLRGCHFSETDGYHCH